MNKPHPDTIEKDLENEFDKKFYEGDRNSTYCKKHKYFATPFEIKQFIAKNFIDKRVLREEIEKIEGLNKLLKQCRHKMEGMKGFTVCCIYCDQSLDEIISITYNHALDKVLDLDLVKDK